MTINYQQPTPYYPVQNPYFMEQSYIENISSKKHTTDFAKVKIKID